MGLTGKCLQVRLVYTKMFNKWYPLLLLLLREVYPSSEILEQARVSQRKGIAIQASSKKHPECASARKGCPCKAKPGLSECTVWKESCIMLFTHTHTHTHTKVV